jgi:hypothetical protein
LAHWAAQHLQKESQRKAASHPQGINHARSPASSHATKTTVPPTPRLFVMCTLCQLLRSLYMTSHAGYLSPPVTRENSFWFHVHYGSGRPKSTPVLRVHEAPPPILPAFKSSTSGCPFEVGPVGLAHTKTHMVLGAPRSYLTSRALTLANPKPNLPRTHPNRDLHLMQSSPVSDGFLTLHCAHLQLRALWYLGERRGGGETGEESQEGHTIEY